MKRILITGTNSYIGDSVKQWLNKWPDLYAVDTIDMIGDGWRQADFSVYDCVYHVAGIAHRNDAPDELYEKVNHLLAAEVAQKAADSGVKQFIFMSSGAVYSQNDKKHRYIQVEEMSVLEPSTPYGISKMNAERDICRIAQKSGMKAAILRPPMVYGNGAKGNYNSLARIAVKSPLFPKVNNQRSMIYIDNLCEFVRLAADHECEGIFLPQNREYVSTTELVQLIARIHGRKIFCTGIFNWSIHIMGCLSDKVNKAFGSYIYLKKDGKDYFDGAYQVVDFETSVRRSEGV